MIKNKIKKNKEGFVLLFVVVISSIILAITLSIANISLKEIKFSTSTKDTNDAFFAADTGAECALYYDKSTINRFISPNPGGTITCANTTITPTFSGNASTWSYNFTVTNLGNLTQGCAKVVVNKTNLPTTQIISKGYNNGGASCVSNSSTVERQLELSY